MAGRRFNIEQRLCFPPLFTMNNVVPAPEVLRSRGRVFPGPLSISQFMIVDMNGPYRYQPFKIISMFRRVETGVRGARQVQLQVDRE